jgi:hypothetical protein
MITQVFVVSTGFGLATLAAAMAGNTLPDAARRVLVLSNNAPIPETAYGVADVAGTAPLLEAFDAVHSYNESIAPQHPSFWQPRPEDLPIWERSLRSLWDLEGELHLVVETISANPALALCLTFADATIDVYADGLMSYAPTRTALPAQVGMRVERLLHLDMVRGARPLLLREYGVQPVVISTESFAKAVAAIRASASPVGLPPSEAPTAVLLGQNLSALRLMAEEEERTLHLQMVERAVAAGFPELVFKAHPSGPIGKSEPLVRRARDLGARLTVCDSPELVETWYDSGEVDLVVGCLSTALATAGLFGVPAARVGTELLLKRLKPFETSNRMAATVIAATVPPLESLAAGAEPGSGPEPALTTEQVVRTVGYLMQPTRNSDLRDAAVELLGQRLDDLRPYVRPSRLAQLGLPGGRRPDRPARQHPDSPAGPSPALSRWLGSAVRRILPPRRTR